MAKKSSVTPSWLRHRALLGAEAALCVGLAQEFGSRFVQGSALPHYAKVLFIMVMTLGLLGALVLFMQGVVSKVLGKTFDLAPLPGLLMHGGIFASLFLLYSLAYNLPVLR